MLRLTAPGSLRPEDTTSVGYIEPFLCRKEREKEMKEEGRREGRGKRREENPHRAVNEPQHLSSVGMDPKSVVII